MIYLIYFLTALVIILFLLIITSLIKIKITRKEQKQIISQLLHGLQTPLTIMKGEIDLYAQNPNNKRLVKHLDKSIIRLSNFISEKMKSA